MAVGADQPSFAYKAREIIERRLLCERASRPDPRFRITQSKLGAYAFLDRLGVPHATVRAVVPLDELTPEHLAGGAVVKPLYGSSSIGVAALRPDGERWVDVIRGRRRSFNGIVQWLTGQLRRLGTVDQWIVEDLHEPPDGHPHNVVDDIKIYSFRGEIGLVLMRRRVPGRLSYRWFDPDLVPVDTGKHEPKIDHTMQLPGQVAEALPLASRISRAAPFAFLRVDTLVTRDGLQVGELNSHVGAYDGFNAEWDERLGEMWERTETLMDGARARPIPQRVVDGDYPLRWWQRIDPMN